MRTLLSSAVLLALTAPAYADDWTGKTVIPKRSGTKIGHTDETGRMIYTAELKLLDYKVRKDKDGYLLLVQNDIDDWGSKSDFVLIDDAVAYFTDRIRENPSDVGAWNRRGWAWQLKGEPDIAIRDFDESLRLEPSAPIYNNRGVCWQK